MRADPVTTVTGNAATQPEARVTGTGRKVTNFRIGSTERRQDRATGEWVDGNSFFVGVACWNALAENVERSVRIGTPLVVTGRISQRTYTDANDKVQFAYEIQADSVAPDLNKGTADFTRVNRNSGPSVGLDEDGQPPVGVSQDEFEPQGHTRSGDVTINRNGSFGLPGGVTVPPAEEDDDLERDGSELVGATG